MPTYQICEDSKRISSSMDKQDDISLNEAGGEG